MRWRREARLADVVVAEPDLCVPSGESLLRQWAAGVRAHATSEPLAAWLPGSGALPATLPAIAAHAGVRAIVAPRLPHARFVWRAPDGSDVVAVCGDAAGGHAWLAAAAPLASDDLAGLPVVSGEFALGAQPGTYSAHRDIKARNAALERALADAEEAVAWCAAVRTAPPVTAPLRDDLHHAWTIVLRNQLQAVMAGASDADVYRAAHEDYDRAERMIARVRESAASILPRARIERTPAPAVAPQDDGDGGFVLDNGVVHARVRSDGTVVELAAAGGPNVATIANALAAFSDRADAANLDATYERHHAGVHPQGAHLEDDSLVVRFRIGRRSAATMQIELRAGEPFVRVVCALAWHEDATILRVEHRLAVPVQAVRFGVPHGSIERPAGAAIEMPGQRFAIADDGMRGCAIFAPDSYGWSARALRGGGVRIGMTLVRSPRRPDPSADRGEHRIAYALAPTAGPLISALEDAWIAYACEERVRLFTCDDPGVLVVATKPADDGDGVIVRVRECDGTSGAVAVRSGARMRGVEPVDALERSIAGTTVLDGERIRFDLPAFALRSFRVRS